MTTIVFAGKTYSCHKDESVLKALLRHEVDIPYSCTVGTCHTCLLKRTDGPVPANSQAGLKPTLCEQHYFLACQFIPEEDISIALPDDAQVTAHAEVVAIEHLNPNICRLIFEPATPLYYHAGQYINLKRSDGLLRSYSLASVPSQDPHLELHIQRLDNGKMSNWIHDELQAGEQVEFRGPYGECFYLPGKPEQRLLLIGTGTGLAPLIGIARDALHSGHSGDIHLYHGSRHATGLYFDKQLRQLTEKYENFHYTACVSAGHEHNEFQQGRANDVALKDFPNLEDTRVYLCGRPAMVHATKKAAYLQGAAMTDIYADAFEMTDLRKQPRD